MGGGGTIRTCMELLFEVTALKWTLVMAACICEQTKSHFITHLKQIKKVHCMACELYLIIKLVFKQSFT